MRRAKYSFDEETQSTIAVVEELPVCWGQGLNHEEAREDLASTVEGYILLSIKNGEDLPEFDGVSLKLVTPKKELAHA